MTYDATAKTGTADIIIDTTSISTGLPAFNEHLKQKGWLNALLETIQMVLLRPAEAFSVMRREGGLIDPLLYTIIIGMVGAVISFVFSFGLRSFGIGRSNGQYSIATTGLTIRGLSLSGARRGRSLDIW